MLNTDGKLLNDKFIMFYTHNIPFYTPVFYLGATYVAIELLYFPDCTSHCSLIVWPECNLYPAVICNMKLLNIYTLNSQVCYFHTANSARALCFITTNLYHLRKTEQKFSTDCKLQVVKYAVENGQKRGQRFFYLWCWRSCLGGDRKENEFSKFLWIKVRLRVWFLVIKGSE